MARTPPLISYRNVLAEATLTASSETEDGAALNAVDGLTYDYWIPGEAASIEFQLSSPAEVQCFGIAAHTLSSSGTAIWLEYWNGSAWVEISRPYLAPTDVTAFDYLDSPVTADLFRVSVSGDCAVGVLWVGPVMPMERNIYQGHTPVTLAERGEIRANQTETGEWRGAAVTVRGAELSASFSNLTGPWVRETFAPFVTSFNEGNPFFWAWYVDKYPREVAYCWPEGDLTVTNSGPRDYMSCSIRASAYLDGPQPIAPIVTTTPYPIYSTDVATMDGATTENELRTLIKDAPVSPEVAVAGGSALGAVVLRDPARIAETDETGRAEGATVVVDLKDLLVEYSESEIADASGVGPLVVDLKTVVVVYSDTETGKASGVTSIGVTLT